VETFWLRIQLYLMVIGLFYWGHVFISKPILGKRICPFKHSHILTYICSKCILLPLSNYPTPTQNFSIPSMCTLFLFVPLSGFAFYISQRLTFGCFCSAYYFMFIWYCVILALDLTYSLQTILFIFSNFQSNALARHVCLVGLPISSQIVLHGCPQ